MVHHILLGNIRIAFNQLYQTLHVVNYIHQANLDLSPLQTDGEYHVATHCSLTFSVLFMYPFEFRLAVFYGSTLYQWVHSYYLISTPLLLVKNRSEMGYF